MKKRLERETENKIIGGVLAGLANYFDQDPLLFRILAVAFIIATGIFPGLLFYIVAWVMMSTGQKRTADYEIVE